MRLAYLYSRYPVLSQTFCDTEMLELERRGMPLLIGAIHSPLTSIRHGHTAQIASPIVYAPPQPILRVWEEQAKANRSWPADLIAQHDRKYGAQFKASTRARNALFFADLFTRREIDRFHVHFANRAAHTGLFVSAISRIPFSVTAHGQDFMADLGSDELLREICAAAEFVAVETDYSRGLLVEKCPDSAAKIHRVFNGMEMSNFAASSVGGQNECSPLRILSIGRLIAFKGFDHLIAACADLRARGVPFTCKIIGDGPLRETLQSQIAQLQLEREVTLAGSLSQEEVRARLRACDVFALAAMTDEAGASDVFPTVILEAMASAKPVVATTLAGIPESVIHGETGLLVPPCDRASLAGALEQLAANREMRIAFGAAGRRRVEENFQVSQTVEPLMELLERESANPPVATETSSNRFAYLIDRWPDENLPHLASEVRLLREHKLPLAIFVCEFNEAARLTSAEKLIAKDLIFLPDEMVIEAEWQTHRAAARQLEDNRANATHRTPAALFLREARYAIALRPSLREHQITHLHATGARALTCATFIRALTGITISATVAADEPGLSQELLEACLRQCVGGRVADAKQLIGLTSAFSLDPAAAPGFAGVVSRFTGLKLADTQTDWQSWVARLRLWSQSTDAVKIT